MKTYRITVSEVTDYNSGKPDIKAFHYNLSGYKDTEQVAELLLRLLNDRY